MKYSAKDNPDFWMQVKTDYLNKDITVAGLCQKHHLKKTELYKFAKENNWHLRSERTAKLSTSSKKLIKKVNVDHKNTALHKPKKLMRRNQEARNLQPSSTLYEALEFITMDLMHRIRVRTVESSIDHDKDARTLSSLVRTYEKLKDIRAMDVTSSKKDEQSNIDRTNNDPDSQRREIAASLEKLIKGI